MKYLIYIFLLFSSSIQAQKNLKGFYQTPSFIEKTAVDNLIVGYGMDFIEYGKIPSYHKVVIWNSDGEIRDEIDLTSKFTYNFRQGIYKGQFGSLQLSPDKKNIILVGRNYQFQGDSFETIIFSYSLETRKWNTLFVNKEYQCYDILMHPTNSDLMIAHATTKETDFNNYEVFLFDIKLNQMIKKIKTYTFPNLPVSTYFSKDCKQLFIFEGLETGPGFIDVFSTEKYTAIKRIPIKDHVTKVYETANEYYFCASYSTFVFNKKDLTLKQTLKFDDVKGVYPESNFMLITEHSRTGQAPKSGLYNLKTKKLHYWTKGKEILQLYIPETGNFIGFNITEFFQYDANYTRNFSAPALENLLPPVVMSKIELNTILK